MAKKILIVGAGAVGQVYGRHFAQAGFDVSFFIKQKYSDELSKGMTLYHLNEDKMMDSPIHFTDFSLLSDWSEAAKTKWDQIYLCISSTAFRHFDFEGLAQAKSDKTIVVFLQPGPEDAAFAEGKLAKERLVFGMISLISYPTPMPGESVPEPGIAYWLPPMVKTPFAGEKSLAKEIIETFKQSGMAATLDQHLTKMTPYLTSILMQFLIALEASQWKFATLKANRELQQQMIDANSEAFDALEADLNIKPPFWKHFISRWSVKLIVLDIGPKVMPMDLETYLKVHFTKVNDQTKLCMQIYMDMAKRHGLPYKHLAAILALANSASGSLSHT